VARRRLSVEFHRRVDGVLWQDGYFERVLRREEDTAAVIRYVLENPVRAGIVKSVTDFPFSWSVETHSSAD
jgi:putative transposase